MITKFILFSASQVSLNNTCFGFQQNRDRNLRKPPALQARAEYSYAK